MKECSSERRWKTKRLDDLEETKRKQDQGDANYIDTTIKDWWATLKLKLKLKLNALS